MSEMYQNPGPGNYATAKGRLFEADAEAKASAARGEGNILPPPERPYNFRNGVLLTLLTIPIAAILAAVFGLNSPTAGAATSTFAILIAFDLFARGSERSPVTGRGFAAATGIGIVTMIIAAAISYPYSLFLTYLYDGGTGGILGSGFARFFTTWIEANVTLIVVTIALVTVISVVIVWRKARAARAHTIAEQ